MPRHHRFTRRFLVLAIAASASLASAQEKMQVGFLWHMHQPIYYPGENITQTQNANRFSFSLYDVHNQRVGPYTTWPRNAVQAGLHLPNLGTQVSFSGSLVENLNQLRNAGVNGGLWTNWNGAYTQARGWNTQQGNTRMDMIGFTYHHALGPLLDTRDLRMQIKMHKISMQNTFGGAYSRGFFPAETAFSHRMIPALVAEGLEWTLFDSIHLERAMKTYPHTNASGMFAPNKADQVNPAPTAWVQLNNLWAPSKVAAPEGYRPAYLQHVNPSTGQVQKIIGVPAARYEGNEDGRGGYGAFLYQTVMDQYRQYNTNPARPMFVMLHHDGDNYGGGSESYYHHNFQNMVNWATGNPHYNVSTVQDYLDRFPVPQNAVVHVEPGSWAGADNGDPEFKKWLGDPNASGWSPDRNSWAVLTAAKNRVYTAEDLLGPANPQNVINNTGTAAERGWHYLTQAMASDHWYWDGTEIWDSNVTRGSNLAVQQVNPVLTAPALANETTPPTIFHPQRDAYNPGELEFGSTPESADFKVWTYAYDVSGLQSVTLKYRVDLDGENPLSSTQNETYVGGPEVGDWISLPMTPRTLTSPSNILAPTVRADEFSAFITGQRNVLLDYYVEAVDGRGNVGRSDIQHVWVGGGTGGGGGGGGGGATAFVMDGTLDESAITIATNGGMALHYALRGGKLYVATNDAGEGSDHFIYLAGTPGAMVPANWAKAGQVAQWAAYLADENDNDWSGWFDASGAATSATGPNGGVLEGTIDLAAEFGGTMPTSIALAVGVFASPDGGALFPSAQVPASLDGDGNIQANEYLTLTLPRGWVQSGSGSWNNGFNWTDASPNAIGAHAQLRAAGSGGVVGSATTIVVDSPVTVGTLTIDSPHGYTVTAAGNGAITFDATAGNGVVAVQQGAHQILAPISAVDSVHVSVAGGAALRIGGAIALGAGKELAISGPGETLIDGVVTPAAGARVRVVSGSPTIATDVNGAALRVDAGVARLDATQQVASLSIASGARVDLLDPPPGQSPRVLVIGSLDVSGKLDLRRGGAIVDYQAGSPLAEIAALLAGGYAGGLWNGDGIISTPAGADATRAIGFSEATDVGSPVFFMGQPVDASAVLLRYTLSGDADLSGGVDISDFARLAAHFNAPDSTWSRGDFNYDGATGIADFALLASNFNQALSPGELSRAVPEPTTVMLLGLGVAGFATRVRRR